MKKSFILATFLVAISALAQAPPDPLFETHPFEYHSGKLENLSDAKTTIYEDEIRLVGAKSIRLHFEQISLGEPEEGGAPTLMRITSLKDGAVQLMDKTALTQWRNTTAFFNGDAVHIEIIAEPGIEESSFSIGQIQIGVPETFPDNESICGPVDDRVLSTDPKTARLVPVGCTGWLIDDSMGCFLTAGHCNGGAMDIAEFNVPLSNNDGSLNHPPPSDQYPIDQASVRDQIGPTFIGNDFAYFGTFPNSNTGLTALEAQGGTTFVLGDPPASANAETIRITGYGTNDPSLGNPATFNQAQTTHTGQLVSVFSPSQSRLSYDTDTTGGNSGSAILNEDTGTAIGIHTNAGCSAGGGANNGMSNLNPDLIRTLEAAIGICTPTETLAITAPDQFAYEIEGEFIELGVDIIAPNGLSVEEVTLHYAINDSTDFLTTGMFNDSGNTYSHLISEAFCGDVVRYWISVLDSNGHKTLFPQYAPESLNHMIKGNPDAVLFEDDFGSENGWTIFSDENLTDGAWERSQVLDNAVRGALNYDTDGNDFVFQTDGEAGNSDVDGGTTTLTSPVLNATQPEEAYLRFFYSYSTSESAAGALDDIMVFEITNDGQNWVQFLSDGPSSDAGWKFVDIRIADFVDLTDQVQIRIIVSDTGQGSVVEAAFDNFAFYDRQLQNICVLPCPLDLNGDRAITETDLDITHDNWNLRLGDHDLNEDGFHDVRDIIHMMDNLGNDCP